MALGNYDQWAVSDNQVGQYDFVSRQGIKVSLYKNWIYLASNLTWQAQENAASATLGEIHEGRMRIVDLEIVAVRGPQSGIYVAGINTSWSRENPGFIGCGVYGYEEDEWVGIQKESFDFLRDFARNELPKYHSLREKLNF